MNPAYLGDSYDIVKRFFCETLRDLGFEVYIDPMFTGDWNGSENLFLDFLGTRHVVEFAPDGGRTALFLDPDTGVSKRTRRSPKHVTIDDISRCLTGHELVFVFDQSFSRNFDLDEQIQSKLEQLHHSGCYGFYYRSHAHFLFATRQNEPIDALEGRLLALGLPASRFMKFREKPEIKLK